MSDELLIQRCDYTVTNNGSLAELDESVREILKDVLPGDGK